MQSVDGVVEEIMNLHRSLPPRPSIEEVEAAMAAVRNVEQEEHATIESISKQRKGFEIPEELFFVLHEMQKSLVLFQSKEQKREAVNLLDVENVHNLFDDLIQRASRCVPSSSKGSAPPMNPAISPSVSGVGSKSGFGSSAAVASSSVYYSEHT